MQPASTAKLWCVFLLAIAFSGPANPPSVWTQHPKLRATLGGSNGPVKSVAFSPDNRVVASKNYDGTIKLWEVSTGQLRATLDSGKDPRLGGLKDSVGAVVFSADGKLLASGNWGNTVKLWDMKTGLVKSTLRGHTDGVVSVA